MPPRRKLETGKPPLNGEPTIRHVGLRAGVSLATVSRVLTGSAKVSEEKKKRVLAAIAALGYTPHEAARSLVRRRTNTVAFILPEVCGDFYSQLLKGAELAARHLGLQLLVSGFHGQAAEVKKALRATRGRVDGIVLMWPLAQGDDLLAAIPEGSKVVLLGGSEDPHHPFIALDNHSGAEKAVRHLVSLGHRVVGHLPGPVANLDAQARRHAFFAVVHETPGAVPVEIPGDFTETRGYEAAPLFLAHKPRPTAIFAGNDASAIGLLLRFVELGVAVPVTRSRARASSRCRAADQALRARSWQACSSPWSLRAAGHRFSHRSCRTPPTRGAFRTAPLSSSYSGSAPACRSYSSAPQPENSPRASGQANSTSG